MKKVLRNTVAFALTLSFVLSGLQAFAGDAMYAVTLKTFSSSKYPEFSCGYPNDFEVYDDHKTTLFTVRSKDKQTDVKINAVKSNGLLPKEGLNSFINSYSGGTTEYKTSGDDYFAARVLKNGVCHYTYRKFKNGNIYYFDVNYNSSDADYGDFVVNKIYKSFKLSSGTPQTKKSVVSSTSKPLKTSKPSATKKPSATGSVSGSSSSSSSYSKSSKSSYCAHCHGSGEIDCPSCNGKGGKYERTRVNTPNYSGKNTSTTSYSETWVTCYKCHGYKKVDCPYCDN